MLLTRGVEVEPVAVRDVVALMVRLVDVRDPQLGCGGLQGIDRQRDVCSPRSKQGPCRPCSGAQKKTEEEARAIMAERGLTPRVPYQSNGTRRESECGFFESREGT